MNQIWKKLGLKEQNPILIMNAPDEFELQLNELEGIKIDTEVKDQYDFILLFAKNKAEGENFLNILLPYLSEDSRLWFCYPKKTSKQYKSDLDRNVVLDLFETYGYRPASQISIDENWSAMWFRKK